MTNNNYLYIIVILLYIIIYNNITLYVNPIPYILIVKLLIVNVRFASHIAEASLLNEITELL